MKSAALVLASVALALGGCVSGSRPAAAPRPAAPGSSIVVVPQVMAAQGLEGLIGASAAALTRRFGAPRIDLAEGDARKLQFAGQTCVIDIYLYPVSGGAELTATYVNARQRQGGEAADGKACLREVDSR